MLEDGPLVAPCCYQLPSTLDPTKLFEWLFHLDVHLLMEIFTLSSKSVLYEMALHSLQRPRHRRVAVVDGSGLAALMRYFAETLRRFEHNALLGECRTLFMNHFEAGLGCIRVRPAVERLLPLQGTDTLAPAASRSASALSSDSPSEVCAAEEVGDDKWVLRDVDEDEPASHESPGGRSDADASRRLRLGADSRLAYSVTLFVWAAVRLLARRIELLQEFPPDHPLFDPARTLGVPKVSSLGDCFEALVVKRKEAVKVGMALYREQRWQEAGEQMTSAMAMPPEADEGKYFMYTIRASCHYHLEEYQPAVEDYTTALRLNPTAYRARYSRAEAYEALGQLDLAVRDLAQLRCLYPGSRPARELHARLAAALSAADPSDPAAEAAGPHSPLEGCGGPTAGSSFATSRDSLGIPESAVSSVGPLSFASSELSFRLASLPAYPEPAPLDDPPYVTAVLESGEELEYAICGGKELGRGAFGRVYKAVHPSGGWFMAIKEVEAREVESEDLLRAFERVVTMRHNNIVRCLGMRRLPNLYHVVMEFCSGGSLRGLIDDLRGLSLSLTRKYATEVLLGLRYMHGHGLLHRDVKASNVLLRDDGTAKLADFGTCMQIPDGEPTPGGSVKGTVLWMAPETFRGHHSPAADVWSFGCMLIEMATAKDPWHEQQFKEQLTAMVFIATRPDALPSDPTQLSDELGRHFFHSCIARDPAERLSADLLLRHPWLSSTEPSIPATPSSSPYTGSIQDSYRDRFGDSERGGGFPWTTCSSITNSAFLESTATSDLFVESLTENGGDALANLIARGTSGYHLDPEPSAEL